MSVTMRGTVRSRFLVEAEAIGAVYLSGSSISNQDELKGWDLSCHIVCCDVGYVGDVNRDC